jgi:hypothetical protein
MYVILENNEVKQVGHLYTLFPNTSNPTHEFALENGAVELVEGEQKDQRFYWVTFDKYEVTGNVVTRTYVNTPKALEDVTQLPEGSVETPEGQTEPVTTKGLKSTWIAQIKAAANSQLASTDWMVIRKAERDVAIPAEVIAERAAIIADCTAKEAAITAATTMEEFINVVAPVTTGEP